MLGVAPLKINPVDIIAYGRLMAHDLQQSWKPEILFGLLLEYFGIKFFIKSEQILRLNEDKIFSHDKAKKTFGYKPTEFNKAIFEEIQIYKRKK